MEILVIKELIFIAETLLDSRVYLIIMVSSQLIFFLNLFFLGLVDVALSTGLVTQLPVANGVIIMNYYEGLGRKFGHSVLI